MILTIITINNNITMKEQGQRRQQRHNKAEYSQFPKAERLGGYHDWLVGWFRLNGTYSRVPAIPCLFQIIVYDIRTFLLQMYVIRFSLQQLERFHVDESMNSIFSCCAGSVSNLLVIIIIIHLQSAIVLQLQRLG